MTRYVVNSTRRALSRLCFEQLESRMLMAVGDLRMVTYNVLGGSGTTSSDLGTVLAAIGTNSHNGVARPIDVLAIQEVNTQVTTTANVVDQLNAIYGPGTYGRGNLNGRSSSGGNDTVGLVYNTATIQLINEIGVGTVSGILQPRQTIRYQLRPLDLPLGNDFYLYNSHFKANSVPILATDPGRRQAEAAAIRANADSLGASASIIYAGDFNVEGSSEPAIQTLISSGNGQAIDPANRLGEWSDNASFRDVLTQSPAISPPSPLVGGGLDDRFDFQLLTDDWFDGVGLDFRAGSYRTFGNNGSVRLNGSINESSNTALSDLSNRLTVLNLLTTVTDHLPVVVDYHFVDSNVNEAPTAIAGGPYSAVLSTDFLLSGTGSDPDIGQTVTYEWDLEYDGVTFDVDKTGPTPTVRYTTVGAHAIALRVTDNGTPALSTIDTTTVSISAPAKTDPVVTWNKPADIIFGTLLTATQLNATSTTPGNFVYLPDLSTKLNAGANQELSVTFTPTDTTLFNVVTKSVRINVLAPSLDYGDAPTRYPVLLAQDGARHTVGTLSLGATVDIEADGVPSTDADGDTGDDGITFIATMISSTVATMSSLRANSSGTGKLDGWIDFNNDGDWLDAKEQVLTSTSVVAGDNLLSFTLPAGATVGSLAARFRLSTTGGLLPTGLATDGEVEDYLVTVVAGSATAVVNIDLPAGVSQVVTSASELKVTNGDVVLFKAPRLDFGKLNYEGSSLDDRLQLAGAGQILDLTNANNTIQDVETIDISGAGSNQLAIGVDQVKAISATTDTLSVIANADDTLTLGAGWKVDRPRFINDKFSHIIIEAASGGSAEIDLQNDRFLQNPLNRFDVDRDGKIQVIDALRILNEIRRRGNGPLALPTNDSEISNLYVDVSGDNQLGVLDALLVLNALARISRGGQPEGESLSPNKLNYMISSKDEEKRQDEAIAEFNNDSRHTLF